MIPNIDIFYSFNGKDYIEVKEYDKKVKELEKEIELLKGDISNYVKITLHDRKEIERLTAESTEWESKFYDEAKKVDKAIEYIEKQDKWFKNEEYKLIKEKELLDILKGDDKE